MISFQGMAEFLKYICLLCGYICLKHIMLMNSFSFSPMHYVATSNGGCLQNYLFQGMPLVLPIIHLT